MQLVPNAFIVRMTRALADLGAETVRRKSVPEAATACPAGALRSVPVRVWAELGRTRMPVGEAVSLPPGAVRGSDQSGPTSPWSCT